MDFSVIPEKYRSLFKDIEYFFVNISQFMRDGEQLADLRERIENVVGIEIESDDLWYTLSQIYTIEWNNGKKDLITKVKRALKNTLRINSNHLHALADLGNLYIFEDKLKKGLTLLREVIELDSDCPQANFGLGEVYRLTGDNKIKDMKDSKEKIEIVRFYYEKAIEYYKKSKELAPKTQMVYIRLGDMYNFLGEYLRAADVLQIALKINPNDFRIHYTLGVDYFFLGELDLARDHLQIYLDKVSFDSHTLWYLSLISMAKKEFNSVIDYQMRIHNKEPNFCNTLSEWESKRWIFHEVLPSEKLFVFNEETFAMLKEKKTKNKNKKGKEKEIDPELLLFTQKMDEWESD